MSQGFVIMRKKTFEEVKSIFDSAGCVLLDTEYINSTTKMNYIAMCGHKHKTSLASFNLGKNRLCKDCTRKQVSKRLAGQFTVRMTTNQVKELLESRGLRLVSEYKNAKTPVLYIAKCGHECSRVIQTIREGLGDFCAACKREHLGNRSRKTLEEIQLEFKRRGCTYISGYKNAYSTVRYIASCGHENSCTLHNFLHGQSMVCATCAQKLWQGEELVYDLLKQGYPNYTVIRQYKIYKPNSGHPLRFDFYIPELSLMIEYNGLQHYGRDKWFSTSDEKLRNLQRNDNFKKEFCKKNDMHLLVIDGRRYTYKNLSGELIVNMINEIISEAKV